jgi:hypothetical protein
MTPSKHKGRGYKELTLPTRAIRAYYWIQNNIKEHDGEFPTYYSIGMFLGGGDNYYSARNRGIALVKRWLEPNGYVRRENAVLSLTDKPLTEANILKE